MSKLKTIKKLLKTNKRGLIGAVYGKIVNSGLLDGLSDENFLKLSYRAYFGYKLNLSNPETFNEKLQWLKLYDRNPKYNKLVDKQLVKEYIAKEIGKDYVIPTLGVWGAVEKIEFEKLPKQFVLKCTHDSGSTVICTDKDNFDFEKAKKILSSKMKKNLFWWGREWPYKDLTPQIIAEKYMIDCDKDGKYCDLNDYKFMCFNGKVMCSFVCSDRFSEKGLHVTFFDRNWNVLPFERQYPTVKERIPKPINYDKMVELAEKLSEGIPFVRVDFYESEKKIYFGEMTFFPGCGWERFTPKEWDYVLGSWIKLPINKG